MSDTPKGDAAVQRNQKTGLDKPIRDHLGRKLRAGYNSVADTPLPSEFEHQLLALEKSGDIREKGGDAVAAALGMLDLPSGESDAPTDRGKASEPAHFRSDKIAK